MTLTVYLVYPLHQHSTSLQNKSVVTGPSVKKKLHYNCYVAAPPFSFSPISIILIPPSLAFRTFSLSKYTLVCIRHIKPMSCKVFYLHLYSCHFTSLLSTQCTGSFFKFHSRTKLSGLSALLRTGMYAL